MNRNLHLLYFSATENTEKIVKSIGKAISDNFTVHDITSTSAREKTYKFDSNDLLIVGSPVYMGRIPQLLVDYFKKIEGDQSPAVFVTSYGNREYDDALLELKEIFEANGFIPTAGGAFIGEHSNSEKIAGGRPDQKDLKKAEEFGLAVKKKLEAAEELSELPELEVKGSYPYKERHETPNFAPATTADCIECAICAEECPVDAISFSDFKDIDQKACINCCSCVQKCPVDAKYMAHPHFKEITEFLIDNFGDQRRQIETFI